MRLLETILVILLVFSAGTIVAKVRRRWCVVVLCVLDIVALVLHAFVEGPHWQMAPAYLAVVLFAAVFSLRDSLARHLTGWVILLLVLAACGFSYVLPIFRLPTPTGPYAIGTRIMYFERDQEKSPSATKRPIVIQIWYPASPSRAARAPYRRLAETTPLSSYQAVLWTHSRRDAPVADGTFPILLLNPAWNGRRTYYTYLVEDLASHGYLVVSIDHIGDSGPIALPDGRVVQPVPAPQMDFESNSLEEIRMFAAAQLETETQDDQFVLDQFLHMNQDPASAFHRRIDMDRVGALGHSFGGAVAAEAALEDPRIKSAISMDGSLWGNVQREGLQKPFLLMEEDLGVYPAGGGNSDHINAALDAGDAEFLRKSAAYRIFLHGSTHSSFTDRSLFSPLKSQSGVGSIPAGREYEIIRAYVLVFFDKTLRGRDSSLLQRGDKRFPEASVEFPQQNLPPQ